MLAFSEMTRSLDWKRTCILNAFAPPWYPELVVATVLPFSTLRTVQVVVKEKSTGATQPSVDSHW